MARTIRLTDAQHSALVAALTTFEELMERDLFHSESLAERLYGTPEHDADTEWTQEHQDRWTEQCENRDVALDDAIQAVVNAE